MTFFTDDFATSQLQTSNLVTPNTLVNSHSNYNIPWYPTSFTRSVNFDGSTVYPDVVRERYSFFRFWSNDPNIPVSQVYGPAGNYNPIYPLNKYIIQEQAAPDWYDWYAGLTDGVFNIKTYYTLSYDRTGAFLDITGATSVYLQGISIALSNAVYNDSKVLYESISVRTTITTRQNAFLVGQLQSGYFLLSPSVANQYISLSNFTQSGVYNPQYVSNIKFEFYIPRKLMENQECVINFKFALDNISIV